MTANIVKINCDNIHDWDSFHDEFSRVLGFPDFYGRNMNAWIDCMTSLDHPEDEMTKVHCTKGKVITIELVNVGVFKSKFPEQFNAILESSSFVNYRRNEIGKDSVIALSYFA